MRVVVWIACAIAFGFAECLTIDSQLTIIRNDCYERLAIGERLDPKDVDKTLMLNTVQDCQMACTQEQEKCRSFSFGIAAKGNATCELSKHVIKETPDLKPIGTKSDVDYDLYIKKLGCKLVLTKEPGNNSLPADKPSPYNYGRPQDKPTSSISVNGGYGNNYQSNRPAYGPDYYGSPNSGSASDRPIKVVSSLIAIASNPSQPSRPSTPPVEKPDNYGTSGYGIGRPYYPNRFDRPNFDRRPSDYNFQDDRPPFRPSVLNHPYNYKPEFYPERPAFTYNDRLDFNDGYDQGPRPLRPGNIHERPGYAPDFLPAPSGSNSDSYNTRPYRPEIVPERPVDDQYRPRPIRPPHIPERPLDDFDNYGHGPRPQRPHDVPEKPLGGYGDSISFRPGLIPERPVYESQGDRPRPPLPERPFDGYGGPRPPRPHDVPDRPSSGEYGPKPLIPEKIPERPLSDSQAYGRPKPLRPQNVPERPLNNFDNYGPGSKPLRPNDIPERPPGSGYGSRPHRPAAIPERPPSNGYGSRPNRPDAIPERPLGDSQLHGYGPRPIRPHDIPDRPGDSYGSNAQRPERPLIDYGPRPIRPLDVPQRPSYSSEPHRPNDIPERPSNSGYGSRPHRPDVIPERPLDEYRPRPIRPQNVPERPDYGSKPNRPNDIPERPSNNGYGLGPYRPDVVPERPDDYVSRPLRPHDVPQRPDNGYGAHLHRPDILPERPGYGPGQLRPYDMPERPREHFHDYGERPNRPYDIPERPFRPDRPLDDGYGPRPDRPIDDFDNYRPGSHRPFDIPDQLLNNDYDRYGFGPHRPNGFDNYGQGLRPLGPDDIPERPGRPSDGYFMYQRWPKPFPPSDYPGNYAPNFYGLDERLDYEDGLYMRPVIYNTDFKRPVFVPARFSRPANSSNGYDKPSAEKINETQNKLDSKNNSSLSNNENAQVSPDPKPIVTQVVGPYGQTITSIITEIKGACFRRVLAGKRVARTFVRRTVACERVEDCQRECSDERRFVCEGFNYRLDPSGRGQGDCELLDLPLSRLDMRRDVYDVPDYDYYERDRNSDAPDCKGVKYYGSYDSSSYHNSGNRYNYYDQNSRGDNYGSAYWGDKYDHGYRQPRPDSYDYDYKYYDNNRRGGYDYHHAYQDDYQDSYDYNYYKHQHSDGYDDHSFHGYHYSRPAVSPPRDTYDYKPQYPPAQYDYKSYEPYLPHGYWKYERPYYESSSYWDKYFHDRVKDKNYWGFDKNQGGWGSYGGSYGNFGAPDSYYSYDYYDNNHRNNNDVHDYNDRRYYYIPNRYGGSKDWGRYGGSYGYGDHRRTNNGHRNSYDYWGFNQIDHKHHDKDPGLLPPYQDKPELGGNYLPPYDDRPDDFGIQHHDQRHHDHHGHHAYDYNDYFKDECSLRMITGFRLHKGIVKKLIAVTNIYECELFCHKEADFPCTSYAFRYTLIPNLPSENCYLSDRHYKELDHYTDLEPDRDCDIYTINNKNRCDEPVDPRKDDSECFWRVRSGQRLDQKIVRDSLNVKSIVDCQLECLRSYRFTCRAFSYRYGSPVIGGAIDNCQLTDWPYLDMDPRIHLIPESGFELYERGSYGHGCEPNHFQIGHKPEPNSHDKLDKMCYVGYGSPARLLPQATKKSLRVETEADCKAECTRSRDKSLFQCMSLSYRTSAAKGAPNCDLSDIVQRDLLSNVDYVADSDSWLFAWDVHNPRCVAVLVLGFGGSSGSSGSTGGSSGSTGGSSGSGGWSSGGNGGWSNGGSSGWNGGNSGGWSSGGSSGSQGGGSGWSHGSGGGSSGGSGGWSSGGSGGWSNSGSGWSSGGKEGGIIIPWFNPASPMDTWRIYSVGGLPCKRGSLCQENKVAGFWYCELEAREEHAWDYCCRPDHQCGYSEGFPYQWCYVGPIKTQWRKCNDRYYPYLNNIHDRFDYHHSGSYLPDSGQGNIQFANSLGSNHVPDQLPPYRRPGLRPPDSPLQSPPPSLDDYDSQFNNPFLDPPKPGGFGQPRHWPISYLHKEAPPNETSSDPKFDFLKLPKGRNIDSKYDAIANLIDVIKSNDLKNVEYQISNSSDKADDVLYVQIPLPANYSLDKKSEKLSEADNKEEEKLVAVDLLFPNENKSNVTHSTSPRSAKALGSSSGTSTTTGKSPVYRRSYITKTNRSVINRRYSKGTVELLPVS